MYNHNKAQQSKNRVYIFWDILYLEADYDSWYNKRNGNTKVSKGFTICANAPIPPIFMAYTTDRVFLRH